MSRRNWINIHLYLAAFFAPGILLMALSGGLYLLEIKGTTTDTRVTLPAGTVLDLKSPSLEADTRRILQNAGIDHDFEYLRTGGNTTVTRPTSRTSYQFSVAGDGSVSLTRSEPDLIKSLVELHKGHGPGLFKRLQQLMALGLLIVVISGLILGIQSPGLRKISLILTASGTAIFVILGSL
ncbi:MAG: PepSY domain-containing protein [Pseudomonadales bacterium]|nr:PepSY domain-containing protein [Pseudomonadales bacterium]